VFAGDGRVVVTDQVFPSHGSDGVALWAAGGTARLRSLTAWPMGSAWGAPRRSSTPQDTSATTPPRRGAA
jgi:fructan beta-fructosidase